MNRPIFYKIPKMASSSSQGNYVLFQNLNMAIFKFMKSAPRKTLLNSIQIKKKK